MKTDGMTDAVLPLTKKQKCLCNVVMGVLLVIAGLILVLAGADVIKASVRDIAAPTVLFGFGIAVLFSATVAKNALSMWLAGVIVTCGIPSVIETTTSLTYGELYPIYIAAAGVGCVLSLIFAEARIPLIKGILFFGILSALFSLQSSGTCGWGLTAGLLAAFIGLCVIVAAVEKYIGKEKENNA